MCSFCIAHADAMSSSAVSTEKPNEQIEYLAKYNLINLPQKWLTIESVWINLYITVLYCDRIRNLTKIKNAAHTIKICSAKWTYLILNIKRISQWILTKKSNYLNEIWQNK